MEKEEFVEAYENIGKIEDLLIECSEHFSKLPIRVQQSISNYHNESAALQYCLRWGLKAAKEIREDWQSIVAGYTMEGGQ